MNRRQFLWTAGSIGVAGARGAAEVLTQPAPRPAQVASPPKLDIHTHFYTQGFFQKIRETGGQFSFTTDPAGRPIITFNGARFFGIQPPMTDVSKRLEDMDRVGIDVEVVSLSTPNVFFADAKGQPDVARMMNDAYADLVVKHPRRFKAFASIPMDAPDAALAELDRAIDALKLNGVILLSNIRGAALTDKRYRPFFEEANRMQLCIFLHPMIPAVAEPFKEYVLGPIIGFPVRHHAGSGAHVLRRHAEGFSRHQVDHRPCRRRRAVPDGANGQRVTAISRRRKRRSTSYRACT